MNNYDASDPHCPFVECIVCGMAMTKGNWFARIEHDERAVAVCGPLCAECFKADPHLYLGRIQTLKLETGITPSWPLPGKDDGRDNNRAMCDTAKDSDDLPKNVESRMAS